MRALWTGAALSVALGSAALAADSYDSLWAEVQHKQGCTTVTYTDYLATKCGDLVYYFTTPSNPAHPAVIEETIVHNGKTATGRFDSKAMPSTAVEAVVAWLNELTARDSQLNGTAPQPDSQ